MPPSLSYEEGCSRWVGVVTEVRTVSVSCTDEVYSLFLNLIHYTNQSREHSTKHCFP